MTNGTYPIHNPRYQLVRPLGEGGFGAVYLAQDLFMGASVAVKVLRARSFDAGERFRRELRLLQSQINNRHVVTVLDADLDADPPYIVLEFCEQGSLRSWVSQRRGWRDVAVALTHAIFGLRGVHAVGGFHRDLKPDNLLIAVDQGTGETIVKVADFGLARVPSTATGPMTYDAKGTIGYIAPEVLKGQPCTTAADVYSLGVVGLELLTGSTIPSAPVPSIVPQPFAQMIRRMLASSPSERPTLEGIARELRAILQPEEVAPIPAPARATNTRGSSARGLLLLLGLGAAALAALASGNEKEWDNNVGRYRGSDGRFRQ
jgi:serine/threonine-protein kinase